MVRASWYATHPNLFSSRFDSTRWICHTIAGESKNICIEQKLRIQVVVVNDVGPPIGVVVERKRQGHGAASRPRHAQERRRAVPTAEHAAAAASAEPRAVRAPVARCARAQRPWDKARVRAQRASRTQRWRRLLLRDRLHLRARRAADAEAGSGAGGGRQEKRSLAAASR
jgi:hypothetical protein